MIVSREHGFGYVHAAKCGGSTIREQLRALGIDDFDGRFFRSVEIAPWGRVNGKHLPLWILECHFPYALETLRSVTTYMLCRDPMDRFISGMAQYFRSEVGKEPEEVPRDEVIATVEEVIAKRRADPTSQDKTLALFIPQVEYANLHGQRVIDHVIALEEIDRLFTALEEKHDLALVRNSVWNPTVTYRFPATKNAIRRAQKRALKILPNRVYARMRDMAIKVLTTPGAKTFEATLRDHAPARDFVEEMYEEDFALHASSKVAVAKVDEARPGNVP